MQIKSLTDSPVFGTTQFAASGTGGALTGPVVLTGNPTLPLQAVPKQYIDNAVNFIPAEKLVSGTFDSNLLPAFMGDVTKTAGSPVITLNTNGVVAGTFTKATVDLQGRVSLGALLVNADMPDLSWGKFTTGVPTTVAGYGITDSLNKAGDTLTGYLNLNNAPTVGLHAVNKAYADSALSTVTRHPTGDVIAYASTQTPAGFFRANGGEVSQTTYSALYAVIGDSYSLRAQPGGGQPWKRQYGFNTTQKNDVTGWTATTGLPVAVYGAQAIVTKNRVFLLGGFNSTTVYTAPINTDGTLGAWTTSNALPGVLYASQAIVTTNRVYLIGGVNSVGTVVATVYTATIDSAGNLSTWTAGTSLPVAFAYSQSIVTMSRVYLLGGNAAGAASSAVYTAPINADGTLGTWTTGTALPVQVFSGAAFSTRNRAYVCAASGAVYTAPINNDGTLGTWSASGSIPGTIAYTSSLVTNGRVYLFGSNASGTPVATVYTAAINADGTLATWVQGTSLYTALRDSSVVATSGKVFLLGGVDVTNTSTSAVQMAAFAGGLNDYSAYYNGTVTYTSSTNFRLPDFSAKEANGLYYYVKQ